MNLRTRIYRAFHQASPTEENFGLMFATNSNPSIAVRSKLQEIVWDYENGNMEEVDLTLAGTFLSLPELNIAEAGEDSFTTSLRSTCIAHTFHLVVKDGLEAGGVNEFDDFVVIVMMKLIFFLFNFRWRLNCS